MSKSSHLNDKKIANYIPNWVMFCLCFTATIIASIILKPYLPIIVSGLGMIVIWGHLEEEKDKKTLDYREETNQKNYLDKKLEIVKNPPKKIMNLDPSPQRRRYLKVKEDKAA